MEFKDMFSSLNLKKIDVAMAGLTLTEEREKIVDFTHGTYNSGLHILVPRKSPLNIWATIRSILNRDLVNIFFILIAAVLVAAHMIWFAEQNGSGTLSGPYIPGIFNAVWWAFVTLATIGYGDYTPVTMLGRLIGMLVILFGLAFFGLYIGQLSSALTMRRFNSAISSPDDLAGKKVATVAGSVSEDILRKLHAIVFPVATIDTAYTELEEGKVAAVVFDGPRTP